MERNLIVYFSRNQENYYDGQILYVEEGNTQIVAEKLQKIINGDLYQIQPLIPYPANYRQCTALAKQELKQQARPKIKNLIPDFESYTNIYLGYPNWYGTMPLIVCTFLESYDFKNKNIYPFVTHEGSGLGSSVGDLKALVKEANIMPGLAIKGTMVHVCDEKLKEWVGK